MFEKARGAAFRLDPGELSEKRFAWLDWKRLVEKGEKCVPGRGTILSNVREASNDMGHSSGMNGEKRGRGKV